MEGSTGPSCSTGPPNRVWPGWTSPTPSTALPSVPPASPCARRTAARPGGCARSAARLCATSSSSLPPPAWPWAAIRTRRAAAARPGTPPTEGRAGRRPRSRRTTRTPHRSGRSTRRPSREAPCSPPSATAASSTRPSTESRGRSTTSRLRWSLRIRRTCWGWTSASRRSCSPSKSHRMTRRGGSSAMTAPSGRRTTARGGCLRR